MRRVKERPKMHYSDILIIDDVIQQNPYDLYRAHNTNLAEQTALLNDYSTQWKKNRVVTTKPKNKKEGVNKFIKLSTNIKSDTQNVHDTAVNKDMLHTYNTLIRDQRKIECPESIADIERAIAAAPGDIKKAAEKVYQRIIKNDHKIYSLGDNVKLKDVMILVWNRHNDQRNKHMADEMKKSFISALADGIENGRVVCSGGLATRLLSSLVLLDHNNDMGKVLTADQYKADIYDAASKLFDKFLEQAKRDDKTKPFADTFTDPDIDENNVPRAAKDLFYDRLSKQIDKLLLTYNPKHVPRDAKENIMAGFQ